MKKISLVLISLLVLAAFASADLKVLSPKTGTQEYFGVAKTIQPAGISWIIGVNYKNGDYLTFTLPTGWMFGSPVSGGYWLVTRSNTSTNYLADANGNALTEWSFFSGGPGQNSVTFRVTDVVNSLFNNATSWFLCTVNSVAIASGAGAIPVTVPAGPPFGSSGLVYNIQVEAIDGINNSVRFDNTPALAKIFTCYPEYSAVLTKLTATIDVLYARLRFAGNNLGAGGNNITITKAAGPFDYSTTLQASDLFRNTVTGDMTGVSYVQFYTNTNHPSSSTQATVQTPGTIMPGLSGTASPAWIYVNGMTTLNNRSFTDTLDFVPGTASGALAWYGRNLFAGAPFQDWITNGTVFRSVWFATAETAGYSSVFRIANHSSVAADVWADVWLDDGQKTTASQKIGTIPANDHLSLSGYQVAHNAGLTPDMTQATAGWKGRVIFTVWAAAETTFGTQLYLSGPHGHTEIALEKQVNAGTWWEK